MRRSAAKEMFFFYKGDHHLGARVLDVVEPNPSGKAHYRRGDWGQPNGWFTGEIR